MLRAGISPHEAFQRIGARVPKPFGAALVSVGAVAAEGGSLAHAMERYPDLFPPDVIAMTEVGESSGYMPEASDEISRQAEKSHHYQRHFWWGWFVAINALIVIPLTQTTMNGLIAMWRAADSNPTSSDMGSNIQNNAGIQWSQFVRDLVWIAPIWIVFAVCASVYLSKAATNFRHHLAATLPIFNKRAYHECYARLAWSLERLMRSGTAPQRAFQIASRTVPNRHLARSLASLADEMKENERLSDVFNRSGAAPEDYAPILATAEVTGDLPGALSMLNRASESEFERATSISKLTLWLMGIFILAITSGIAVFILAYNWSVKLPQEILSGFDTP
jgi:type II secretory pathway component PulF